MNKFISTLLIIISSIIFLAAVFSNSEASLVSDSLVEEGIKLYEAGEPDKAIERFSKALIIEPDNKTAKEYLGRMGMSSGLYAPEKGGAVHPIREMSREVKEYKDKLSTLEEEKFQKEKLAQNLAQDKETLKRAIATQEEELGDLRQELDQMQQRLSFRESLSTPPAQATSSEDVDLLKNRIDRQLRLVDEKDQQIKDLRKQLKASEKSMRQKSLKYENKLVDLNKDYRTYKSKAWRKQAKSDLKVEYLESRLRKSKAAINELDDDLTVAGHKLAFLENQVSVKNKAIETVNKNRNKDCPPSKAASSSKCPDAKVFKEQDKKIAVLKEKLARTHKEIIALRKNINHGGQEDVAALKKQLADISSELKNKDAVLADEEAAYEILEQRLKDAQERLDLADQMIQEKDEQIRQMEEQIGDL